MSSPSFTTQAERLVLTIPGEPVAQGRPRFSRFSFGKPLAHPRAIDPEESREWKDEAARFMRNALLDRAGTMPVFPTGALELHVLAMLPCRKTDERKQSLAPARWKDTRPDSDNYGKAVMDAGTGILWTDDGQVARLIVDKVLGAQGQAPCVRVKVRRLTVAELLELLAEAFVA